MGQHWGDEGKPLPDWVMALIAVACLIGIIWGLAVE